MRVNAPMTSAALPYHFTQSASVGYAVILLCFGFSSTWQFLSDLNFQSYFFSSFVMKAKCLLSTLYPSVCTFVTESQKNSRCLKKEKLGNIH